MRFSKTEVMRWSLATIAAWLVLAGAAVPARANGSGLIDTDTLEDPFVQLNDVATENRDTFTIRGRVEVALGENPVADGVANGVTVTVLESATPAPPVAVGAKTFTAAECKAVASGRSLYCKDSTDGSFFRLRRSSSPTKFRVNTVVRRQEFVSVAVPVCKIQRPEAMPAQPFETPLSGDVQMSLFNWLGETDPSLCRVTQNGERTTCRVKK